MRPVIALAMGDPAGISPELTAKLLALDEVVDKARIVVIGDRRVLDDGARIAAVKLDLVSASPDADLSKDERAPVFHRSRSSRSGVGHAKHRNRRRRSVCAHQLPSCADDGTRRPGRRGLLHAVQQECHAPCASGLRRRDQLFGRRGRARGPASEFNVLDGLWNARVTSHIPLAEVASHITRERVLRALRLTDASMRAAGFERPRIAVAGLNPHAGDGGNFGREEIDAIGPAVEQAICRGHRNGRSVSRRYRFLACQERRIRCRAHDVSRPGPDRDEADGLRSRRDAAGWLPVSDLHAGPRHGLRHRRQGNRRNRGRTRGDPACRRNGAETKTSLILRCAPSQIFGFFMRVGVVGNSSRLPHLAWRSLTQALSRRTSRS